MTSTDTPRTPTTSNTLSHHVAARPGLARHRLPVLALAAASLLGAWPAAWPGSGPGSPSPDGAAAGHGVLMTLGFLGTLIALERAVALRRAWGYLAPILSGVGGLAIIAGVPAPWPPLLMAAAGAWLCAGYVVMWQRQPTLHITVEALGALAWWGCAMVWLTGTDLPGLAPWLAAYIVLTIAGERLELARVALLGRRYREAVLVWSTLILAGSVLTIWWPSAGGRVLGVGLLVLSAWLVRYDVARHTVRPRPDPLHGRLPADRLRLARGRRGDVDLARLADRRTGLRRNPARGVPGLRHVDGVRPRSRSSFPPCSGSGCRTTGGTMRSWCCCTSRSPCGSSAGTSPASSRCGSPGDPGRRGPARFRRQLRNLGLWRPARRNTTTGMTGTPGMTGTTGTTGTTGRPPAGQAPRRPRRSWHLRANAVVLAYLLLSVLTIVLQGWPALPMPRWLAVHLLLLGAVTNAIVTWTEHIAVALLRARQPTRRAAAGRLAALNLAIVGILCGVAHGVATVTAVSATLLGVVVLAHLGSLLRIARHALMGRFAGTVKFYVIAGIALVVASPSGRCWLWTPCPTAGTRRCMQRTCTPTFSAGSGSPCWAPCSPCGPRCKKSALSPTTTVHGVTP